MLVERIGGREFVAGNSFSAADVCLASVLHLAHQLHLVAAHPRLFEFMMRHARRPGVRRAVGA